MEGSSAVDEQHIDDTLVDDLSKHILLEYLHNRKGEEWVAKNIVMTEDIGDNISCVKNGTTIGVSDSSFKLEFGNASWVIKSTQGTQWIMGQVVTPGFKTDQSPYWSKISGLYTMAVVVNAIQSLEHPVQWNHIGL